MRMNKQLLLCGCVALAASSQAQLIIGNDAPGSTRIYYVDLSTGNSTALYTGSDYKAKPWGIAADNNTNTLYWCNGTKLMKATYASLRSTSPNVTVGDMRLAATGHALISFVGLAFNPVTFKLIGSTNVPTKALYEIDPVTRLATPLYTVGSSYDFGGLDCDDAGHIFGLNDLQTGTSTTTLHRSLYQIASSTPTRKLDIPDTEFDVDGLAINGGTAYLVTDGPSNMQGQIYSYDIATGVQLSGTYSSPFTQPATFSGASYAPNLGTGTAWLSGTLDLASTGTFGDGVRKHMEYKVVQGSTLVYHGYFVVTQSSSAFSVPVPTSLTGSAYIYWNGASYLVNRQSVSLTGSNLSVGSVSLYNGDVDDSGEVDAADIDKVIACFGAMWPGPLCQDADCDASGEVDASDIDIAIATFGELNGYPWPG